MRALDFSRWAVVAHKDSTGFGRQASDARKILGLGRHIVIPSERLSTHPLNGADEILVPTDAPAAVLEAALEGLQGILFFERSAWYPNLLKIARKLGVATVCVPNWEWFKGRDPNWKDCDLFACPHRMALNTLTQFGWKNTVLLPWCLDIAPLPAPVVKGPARLFIHNAGLVDPDDRKGTRDTIEAFRRTRRPDIRLQVRLQKEVPLPRLDDRIEVRTGDLPSHADLYSDAAVAIQPSKMEGIGFMVLEAVCAGLPVITIDYPPMNEFVHQPEMRVALQWWKRRAFPSPWVKQAHLRLPRRNDLIRKIEWCADHDMASFSAQNRAWALEMFDPVKLRSQWSEALETHLPMLR